MAIVPMLRATIIGRSRNKTENLAGLQDLGILHLVTAREARRLAPPSRAHEAYVYLKSTHRKRRQVLDDRLFSLDDVIDDALRIREALVRLEAEKDFLEARIDSLAPWGNFHFPDLAESGRMRFWFYILPSWRLGIMDETGYPWECVYRDPRYAYVVVIAEDEPVDMPVARIHTGDRPLDELRHRLYQVETEIEDLHWQRFSLTRWLTQLARQLAAAEDHELLLRTASDILDDGDLFVVEGWCPRHAAVTLRRFTDHHGLLVSLRSPAPNEEPPTLLEDGPPWTGGSTLVRFYSVPSYELWDPSRPVLVFFTLFFAMIISDAGYGLVLGLLFLLFRRRLRRTAGGLHVLAGILVAATIGYGSLTGSFFGMAPPAGSFLARMQLFRTDQQQVVMTISIAIGVIHLILANGGRLLFSAPSRRSAAPLGWILIIGGCFLLWIAPAGSMNLSQDSGQIPGWRTLSVQGYPLPALLDITGKISAVCGLVLVFLSGTRPSYPAGWRGLLRRLADGLLALAGLPKAFGDVLSYLRLFALGLASAKLAATFNELAREAVTEIAGLGVLTAVVILTLGHGLNLLLAVVSGVVHGLRLNFIEFFNWGIPEEGYPFKPFQKRRIGLWNQF